MYLPKIMRNSMQAALPQEKPSIWVFIVLAVLATLVAMAGEAFAQNDFSGDTTLVALWKVDNGAITTDSEGTNTFTNNNSVTSNTGDYKEGDASADLEFSSDMSLSVTDGDLDSGFPLKSGEANKDIMITMWFNCEALPGEGVGIGLFQKTNWMDDDRSFNLYIKTTAGDTHFEMVQGHTAGTLTETIVGDLHLAAGRWYHLTCRYRESDKAMFFHTWDDTAKTITTYYDTFGQGIWIDDADLYVGNTWDGELDEVAVFDTDFYSVNKGDEIRRGEFGTLPVTGQYDFWSDTDVVSLWRFEEGSLGQVSTGENGALTLDNDPANDTGDYKEGACSVDLESGDSDGLSMLDASLIADFPIKNGGTGTFSACGWIKFESLPGEGDNMFIMSKGASGEGTRTMEVIANTDTGNTYLKFLIGYDAGGTWETVNTFGTAVSTGVWYHWVVTFNNGTKAWVMDIWDDTAKTLLGAVESGTATNNMNIEDANFNIGMNTTTDAGAPSDEFDGKFDAFAFFKDIITEEEIDEIRGEDRSSAGQVIFSKDFLNDPLDFSFLEDAA